MKNQLRSWLLVCTCCAVVLRAVVIRDSAAASPRRTHHDDKDDDFDFELSRFDEEDEQSELGESREEQRRGAKALEPEAEMLPAHYEGVSSPGVDHMEMEQRPGRQARKMISFERAELLDRAKKEEEEEEEDDDEPREAVLLY